MNYIIRVTFLGITQNSNYLQKGCVQVLGYNESGEHTLGCRGKTFRYDINNFNNIGVRYTAKGNND